jgi:hypothetical protein
MRLVDCDLPVTLDDLRVMAGAMFGDLIKAVVDVRRETMAIDAELHSDAEAFLLERGSAQEDLWGINLYPELQGSDFVEFDSIINLRPSRGNRSRGVEDPAIRERILAIIRSLVTA